ncbi:hypothetical protein MNBD_GAMMA22-2829 [hydrothermal vent metagenome]|uniref:DUF350 domain-containing protein n=1 Tax=hydrothermal vent metagenome TaxID=652676 RepID=A0A3B1AMS7_9ZZZZ
MLNTISLWHISIIGIDLIIAIIAISSIRHLQGLLAGVNTTDELSKKDNFAFGISIAGGALAVSLILFAAVSGDASVNLLHEAGNVAVYALAGILFLKIGTIINDAIIFNKLSLKTKIAEKNISAGIVQAANMVALGVIIHSAMNWESTGGYQGLIPVALVFIASQIILLIVTRLRGAIYQKRHEGKQLQEALSTGNVALAIRYAGHILGTALALSAASGMVVFLPQDITNSMISWFAVAIVITILLSPIATIARMVVLSGINIVDEIDNQQNVGVAYIEAAIYIAIGFIFKGLLG